MSVWRKIQKSLNRKVLVYVVTVLLPIVLLPLAVSPHQESKCAYVMVIVALYWLLEPVPIAVTALLPVVLFPMLGVVGSVEICQNYMKESYMMFIGGLIVAIAVEESRLHERIALRVLLFVGTKIQWLMLGFMLTTMVLSMWVSNTATTAMMIPIVNAVLGKICGEDIPLQECSSLTESKQVFDEEDNSANSNKGNVDRPSTLKVALLLSICYSANIGGTGTLTGTGPNIVFKGMLEELHPESDEITFATWMMYNVPGMVICVLVGWFYLWLVYLHCSKVDHNLASDDAIYRVISQRYKKLGSPKCGELSVIVLFLVLVCLWIFRDPKFIPGWAQAMGPHLWIGDSVPAIAVSFLLFILPSNLGDLESPPILQWKTAQAKLPWGVILLTGGGFALANGAQKSGLSFLLGDQLSTLSVLPVGAVVAVLCIMTAMITEVASNTTTATILMPVLSQMALSIGVNPLYLMLPVTVVCSYAFMLPVATPPNAIAFEGGNMRTMDMAKPGLVMNLVCCAVQLFMINTLGGKMFDLNTFPAWATRSSDNFTSFPENSLNGTEKIFENVTMFSSN